ncbi:MAG TPA: hypothetical protein VGP72_07890 [Planctomycetota bacterium]|jgi:tetratricopeptide (TPR) repeat protein
MKTKFALLAAVLLAAAGLRAGEKPQPTTITNTEAKKWVEEAEAAVKQGDLEESFKCYGKAAKLEDSLPLHRRLAHFYFDTAEKTKNDNWAEFQASVERWNKAKDGAMEDRRSLFTGKYKKFNPENRTYVDATTKHQKILDVIEICFPLYDKAMEGFNAIMRLSPHNSDFDAAGHMPLCLASKGEVMMRMRTRQLLNAFLMGYKPSNDAEKALYKRCQDILDKWNR